MQLLMVKATYTLVIRAHHYRNSEHKLSNGFCCEINRRFSCNPWFCFLCQCDNYFRFCLRRSGTSPDDNSANCPLGSYRTGVLGDDDFSFSSSASGVLTFHGDVWPVSRCRFCENNNNICMTACGGFQGVSITVIPVYRNSDKSHDVFMIPDLSFL